MATLALTVSRVDSPLGLLRLVTDAEGRVRALDYDDYEPRMNHLLRLHYADGLELTRDDPPPAIRAGIERFFAGELTALDQLRVESGGSAFQRTVWQALRQIPPATTVTYGQLAARIGRPSASRAVGAANGANPIAIIVPCHRVIGSNGTLTGYGGGLERKRWLLAHEQRSQV